MKSDFYNANQSRFVCYAVGNLKNTEVLLREHGFVKGKDKNNRTIAFKCFYSNFKHEKEKYNYNYSAHKLADRCWHGTKEAEPLLKEVKDKIYYAAIYRNGTSVIILKLT